MRDWKRQDIANGSGVNFTPLPSQTRRVRVHEEDLGRLEVIQKWVIATSPDRPGLDRSEARSGAMLHKALIQPRIQDHCQ